MLDPAHPIARLLEEDHRYTLEAYVFIFESLRYAQDVLRMGDECPTEPLPDEVEEDETPTGPQRHVTGQELCEAIRRYALDQYGYMAKTVLNSWGLHGTGDFGEIVFNLIRAKQMRKTPADTRVDFDNVYDFDVAFQQQFKITRPE
ncbi:MAG: Minf_1886 family protein [Thermoguttaceae bacterium]